jgi:DNA topoisomerase-2
MGILKLEDAHLAGTSESIDCTLFLTEGDSVKAVVVSGLEKIGYDKYGVFPLGRKLLNVRVATSEQIAKNLEVNNLMKILGLEYGKKYDTVEDLKSLRYGRLVIMTDPDPDGAQFKGLIINFLHYNWPSLLRLPFLQQFIIPIVKATKGIGELAESLTFYSLDEFEQWKTQAENWRHYHVKHYKGLATLRKEEAKECFSNLQRHQIDFRHGGDDDDRTISMAFNNKHLEEWRYRLNVWKNACKDLRQLGFSGDLYAKDIKEVSYHDFVKKDLIRFRNMEYVRLVPSLMDGFNERQRKTLYTCIKRDYKEEINVAQLAVSVAENCAYYQPGLLIGTITGLAQDFVGSNNINLLIPNGQFASRHLVSNFVNFCVKLFFYV